MRHVERGYAEVKANMGGMGSDWWERNKMPLGIGAVVLAGGLYYYFYGDKKKHGLEVRAK